MGRKRTLAANDEVLDAARRVIDAEIDGLARLREALGGQFVALVEMVYAVRGRVVLSGVGKSAHVAGKIASTLASTGTPALFVHGSEASHGDLGMVTGDDVVVLFSKSGETRELNDLASYCATAGVPVALVTGSPGGRLARRASVIVALPDAKEACAITNAPTTSITMMSVVGDALAVALLERRGFGADDFKTFHPGGALGAALAFVSEVMHRDEEMPLVATGVTMEAAILEMTSKGFGCTGVVDGDGRIVGIVTDGDLRRHMSPDLMTKPVEAVMSPSPITVGGSTRLGEALRIMTGGPPKITALFVVDDEVPVGLVHLHDCLRAGLVR
jgi:arabinose-5-phosphate isomerase